MKKLLIYFAILSSILSLQAQTKVFTFSIDEQIAKPAKERVALALEEAATANVDLIILHLNTFGGELEAADEIRTMLLKSETPIYAFIDVNAASAGALISIACDSIYMAPGASIGAASVVNQTGEVLPDKYQSYMRSLMRATAITNGRDPDIAQAMVDPDIYIEGIIDSGKVLTFTTQEAITHNFCEGEADNIEAILVQQNITNYEIVEQKLSWIDLIVLFLMNPMVSGLLIMAIIGGVYFELQTPGLGFPIIVALTAAILYFAPFYLNGLAEYWEIALFIVGIILLIVEIFVVPGFGIAGILGIISILVSLVLVAIYNVGFDFSLTLPSDILKRVALVFISIFTGFIAAIVLAKRLLTASSSHSTLGHIALNTEMGKEEGYLSQDAALFDYVGMEGETVTILRPSGRIKVNGEILDAVAQSGYIEKGEKINIISFENSQFTVIKAE